jgi:hypothetical protein
MAFRRCALIPGLMIAAQLLPVAVAAETSAPPERVASLVVYGDDPCPAAEDEEEIVVCARRPEEERYRIPRRFRERSEQPSEVSWASRIEALDEAARPMRPDSCSVVGAGGQTGCTAAMIRQWLADRRARAAANALIP